MALMAKNELYYDDYSWEHIYGDDPEVTGQPDSTLLNRKEGYEILYFINVFCKLKRYSRIEQGIKVERMIREDVPSTIRSQENIKNWIEKNWNNSKF